ncbi:MAG: alpha/beta fold hydrolase [Myxococcota bacterium]
MIPIHESRISARDGTQLAVYECGAGPGPVLMLANGLGGNIDAWRYFIEDFGTHHRILSWDYRGLYHSGPCASGSDYTVQAQVDDLRAVLDHFGVDQAVLIGWSMGVQVVFEFYRHQADRVLGLVLVNGTYGKPFATAFAPVLGKSPVVPFIPAIMRALQSIAPLAEPLQPVARRLARTRAALRTLRLVGLVGDTLDEEMFVTLAEQVAMLHMPRYMATLNALGEHCTAALLPFVDRPTLIVSGDRDLFTPISQSREMAARIPNAELLEIAGGSHYTPLEFPGLIHGRVQRFLKERLGFERSAD